MNEEPRTFLPSEQFLLPIIPIREGILFPHTEAVLTFGRKQSLTAIRESTKTRKMVVILSQKNAKIDHPKPQDLYQVGTLAVIERTLKSEDSVSALVRGVGRVRVDEFVKTDPSMAARVSKIHESIEKNEELTAMVSHLQKEFRKTVQMGKPVEFLSFMKLLSGVSEGELADQVASTLNLETKVKQELLEMANVNTRVKAVMQYLSREMKVMEIEKDVVHKTQAQFDKHMRESVLRERLRTIQKELGEIDEDEEVAKTYTQRLKKTPLPAEVKKKVKKEIKRLRQMSVNNPEAGYVRSWIDTIFDLPWGKTSKSIIELPKAEKILNKNHHGLKEVKDRVLEHMAVLKLKHDQATKSKKDKATVPTILCFVGPPGVGKTSIGRSIAEAMNRKFAKISLGGIRDEAEIRGHRRTYVGAMTGRIIKGITQAGSSDPVFMLDEVDKIGSDFRGDPSAALLEVLDPEQNSHFEDHYLDVPFDLSKVLFITTANTLDTIPPALKDRLEIIEYSGYTHEEKLQIAQKHLMKKTLQANGLKKKDVTLSKKVLEQIIQRYTREAGVRDLERNLGKLMRKVARNIVEAETTKKKKLTITIKNLHTFLGIPKYDATLTEEKNQIGVSTGMAWTSVGGDILFIEVALTPGEGKIVLTGKLGDVMKESAQAALTVVKSNAKKLGIKNSELKKTDVHIHVPEGAVPKDGPSAGITITTAIVSAFTNTPVKKDVAMTGEITLRGRVLPIGGLKEKMIAAHRAGSKTILIPKSNKKDLAEIPDSVKNDLSIHPVENIDEVLKYALV